ncbi:MAG: hypothetical protein R3E65_02635 [Steroidobacteraceae bacterium]
MSTPATPAVTTAGFKRYYQAPLPAIIAVLIVYFWQGLGHTVMYLMEHRWFPDQVLLVAFLGGLIGAVMIYIGRNKSENAATLLGFAGGSLVWLGWIEFSFVWVADDLGVQEAMWGAKPTLPEYRVMLSSIGVLYASLLVLLLQQGNALQRLHVAAPAPAHEPRRQESGCPAQPVLDRRDGDDLRDLVLLSVPPRDLQPGHLRHRTLGHVRIVRVLRRLGDLPDPAPLVVPAHGAGTALRHSNGDHCLERQRDPGEMGSPR